MATQKKSALILFLFVTTLIWSAALSRPDGKTHFWTAVNKDRISLIIRSTVGNFALINPSPVILQELGHRLPFYERRLSLVVMTDPKPSSTLGQLATRYAINEVWQSNTDQNVSKDTKIVQLSGQQPLSWEDLKFKLWSLPGQASFVTIIQGKNSLALAEASRAEFWGSAPSLDPVTVLIGPSLKRSIWLTDWLYQKLQPELTLVEGAPLGIAPSNSPDHQEIVWGRDSWYINPSP